MNCQKSLFFVTVITWIIFSQKELTLVLVFSILFSILARAIGLEPLVRPGPGCSPVSQLTALQVSVVTNRGSLALVFSFGYCSEP